MHLFLRLSIPATLHVEFECILLQSVWLMLTVLLIYSHQWQAEVCLQDLQTKHREIRNETVDFVIDLPKEQKVSDLETESNDFLVNQINEASKESLETIDSYNGNTFLRRLSLKLGWFAWSCCSMLVLLFFKITFNYFPCPLLQICCWGKVSCFPLIPSMGQETSIPKP